MNMASNIRLPDLFNLNPWDDPTWRGVLKAFRSEGGVDTPQIRLDVSEADDAYTVRAEIPGVRKEDIDVRIDGAVVSLSAEVKKEKEEKQGERVLRSERSYGYASRSFTLGGEVDAGKVQAKYDAGVLTLMLPKKSPSEAKRISVE
jgi:HSP20 family protein